jgi:hypothetical protein
VLASELQLLLDLGLELETRRRGADAAAVLSLVVRPQYVDCFFHR